MAMTGQTLPPLFQKNEILFGHDATPELIACELIGSDHVKIFRRDDGRLLADTAPLQPIMLSAGDGWLKGWKGEAQVETLAGRGAFNRLAFFPDLKQAEGARSHVQKLSGKTPSAGDAPYWYFSDAVQQFLLLSGKTHFLGLTFGQLRRRQLDIETYCEPGFSFPNAARDSDRITAIALADSTGWEHLISGKDLDEADMLCELVEQIRRRDPDVIEGHNIFRFDPEYIEARAQRVFHCDVTSLYPSIMLVYRYLSKKDELEVFPKLLRDLRAFRVKAKEMARSAADEESRLYFDALQATFKILLNSFYGYLGFALGHFNDFEVANQVTAKGRELIQTAVAWLKENGAAIIEVDTDGIYFKPPDEVRTPADEEKLIVGLGEILPKRIELELDGRYPAMFSYKMKNYALLDEQGRLRIKGSGLRSRGLELFQREWLEEMLILLLKGEKEKIPDLYRCYLDDIENHRCDISG